MAVDLPKIPCVYAIRHVGTGKIYIGETSSLKVRIEAHLNALRRGEHHVEQFQYDYDHFGKDVDIFILGERKPGIEKLWFTVFKTTEKEFGYNYKEPGKRLKLDDFERIATIEKE